MPDPDASASCRSSISFHVPPHVSILRRLAKISNAIFPRVTAEDYLHGLNLAIVLAAIFAIAFGPNYPESSIEGLSAATSILAFSLVPETSGSSVSTLIGICVVLVLWIGMQSMVGGIVAAVAGEGGVIPPGATKASVLVPLTCGIFFVLHMIRMRSNTLYVIGKLMQLFLIIGNFSGFWAIVSTNPLDIVWRIEVVIAITGVLVILPAFFLVPLPSGPRCQRAFVSLLELQAQVSLLVARQLEELLEAGGNSPIAQEHDSSYLHTFEGSSNRKSHMTASSTYIDILALDLDINKQYGVFSSFLKSTKFDFNLYGTPHRFPQKAFQGAARAATAAHQVAMVALRYIAKGGAKSLVSYDELTRGIVDLCKSLHDATRSLASVVAKASTFSEALEKLRIVELASLRFRDAKGAVHDLSVLRAVDFMLLSALSLQGVFEKMPDCIDDASASDLERHMSNSLWTRQTVLHPQGNGELPSHDSKSIGLDAFGMHQELLDGIRDYARDLANSMDASLETNFKQASAEYFLDEIAQSSTIGKIRVFLFHMAEKLDVRWWHWALSLQASAALMACAALVVSSEATEAFEGRSWWSMLTVCVVSDKYTRGSYDLAIQRVLGTTIGAAVAALVVCLGYLASGLSYTLNSAGVAVECIALTICMSLCRTILHAAAVKQQYMWKVAGSTAPLLVVISVGMLDVVWRTLGFRLAATLLGVCFVTICALVLFPVTSNTHLSRQIGDSLSLLASLIEAVGEQGSEHASDSVRKKNHDTIQNVMVSFAKCMSEIQQWVQNIRIRDDVDIFCCRFGRSSKGIDGKTSWLPTTSCCCCIPSQEVTRNKNTAIAIQDLVQEFRREETIQIALAFLRDHYAAVGPWELDAFSQSQLQYFAKIHAETLRTLRLFIIGIVPLDMAEMALSKFKQEALKAMKNGQKIDDDKATSTMYPALTALFAVRRTILLFDTIQNMLETSVERKSWMKSFFGLVPGKPTSKRSEEPSDIKATKFSLKGSHPFMTEDLSVEEESLLI